MAQLGRQDEFEDRNAGVAAPEPQNAGPGFMGKILTTFSNVKNKVSSPRTPSAQSTQSTPSTPSGVETGAPSAQSTQSTPSTPSGVETEAQPSQETKVDDLNDAPRDAETRDVSMPPSRTAPAVPEQSSTPDQIHNDAVGLDTAGAGGRVGDGVETSSAGGAPMVNSRSVDTGTSQEGTPANPTVQHQRDFGEKIMDKLPFTHTNPYSVGNPTPTQQAGNPYTTGDQTAVPASPSTQSRESHSPGLFGKLKNLVTGQKSTQGTATENATTGTAGTTGEREPLVQGYTEEPSPNSGDIFHKATEKLGRKGPDVDSAEAWPSPAKPDMSNIPSATRTDEQGRPIEGPTQPISEDTKKEGLMTKLMDKLHLHGPNSPTAASAAKGTSPTANSAQNTGAGMPTYTEHAPASSNPEGQATGPVET